MAGINGDSADPSLAGVEGDNTANGPGVWGSANPNGRGVVGVSDEGVGVWGHTKTGRGVVGVSDNGVGVWGANRIGRAVVGAVDTDGTGVWGEVKTGTGVVGVVNEGDGVGVSGRSATGDGLRGTGRNGVSAFGEHTGVFAKGPVNAGFFEGNVAITGNLTIQGVSIQTWLQRIVQLEQRASSAAQLEQKVQQLQDQLNTAVSNLTGRVTLAETNISALKAVAHTHQ